MKRRGYVCVLSLLVGVMTLGAASENPLVRVFFDIPQAQLPPQEILSDDLFVSESAVEAASPSQGKQRVEFQPGTIFEVPIFIEDGAADVVSYAFRIAYPKKLLKILEIRGGVFPGFSQLPLTNPATFTSGRTDFTAQNTGFLDTPSAFNVATVVFEVIGQPGKKGNIQLQKTPRADVVFKSTFEAARRVQFRRQITLHVVDES